MHVVSTDNIPGVPGNCGNINLAVYNGGNGDAVFESEVDSSKGAILSLTYTVQWDNYSKDIRNSFGNSLLFPGNPWTNSTEQYTQSGYVTGTLSVTDIVGFGTKCAGSASDYVTVT